MENKENKKDWNIIFDQKLKSNTIYAVKEIEAKIEDIPSSRSYEYDPKKKISTDWLERFVNNEKINEDQKLEFLDAAIANGDDVVYYMYSKRIKNLESQSRLKELLANYIEKVSDGNKYKKYDLLQFKLMNGFDEAPQLVDEYFST